METWQRHTRYDVFFLDIDMPGSKRDGMQLAYEIRAADREAIFIFVSHYESYACQSMEIDALRFLRKPVTRDDVFKSMDIAFNRWDDRPDQGVALKTKDGQFILYAREIRYINAQRNTLEIYLIGRTKPVEARISLQELLARLPQTLIVQCHRGIAVSLKVVRYVSKSNVVIFDDTALPIGSKYTSQVQSALDRYYRGGEE